ncbi:hypothetical protein LJR034_009044 [Caballeronia sp. LjRoot34]|uniref:hypothetical protein n=1 Tax=Caballeronia sp. LjRoot34 TaxID=3342325 RepID=UPI003ECDA7AC
MSYDEHDAAMDEMYGAAGDTAKGTAVFRGGASRPELAKKLDANQYGWLTKSISCDKTA